MTEPDTPTENVLDRPMKVDPPADRRLEDRSGTNNVRCEICNQPVPVDQRREILRAGNVKVWRHDWHLESVDPPAAR